MELQGMTVFQEVPEGYTASIEEFPGANTQGASLEEARSNLREAVAMVIEANRVMDRRHLRRLDSAAAVHPVGAVVSPSWPPGLRLA